MAETKKAFNTSNPALSQFQLYLYANLLFWSFLLLVGVIAFFTCGMVWDDVTVGLMKFLFLLMGGGFTLVSVMSYLYDKHLGGEKE